MKKFEELGHIALGTLLRQLAAQVSKDAENTYQKYGFDIEPKWFPVFYVMASNGAESVVNIAKTINQSHASVSKIIKEMKSADLIQSERSPQDTRVTLVKLNDRAKAMIPAMQRQCEAVDKAMVQLTKETGIDLWRELKTIERHLTYRPISDRVSETIQNPTVIDYAPIHQAAFRRLNIEWISKYFEMEEMDYKALDDPEGYILNHAGAILIAMDEREPVGCCALIKMDNDNYELAKMAVSPKVQGKGIGSLLGQKIVERAKQMGVKRLYLESNSRLTPALKLYEKLGFKHIEGLTSPYERCDVQMELIID